MLSHCYVSQHITATICWSEEQHEDVNCAAHTLTCFHVNPHVCAWCKQNWHPIVKTLVASGQKLYRVPLTDVKKHFIIIILASGAWGGAFVFDAVSEQLQLKTVFVFALDS